MTLSWRRPVVSYLSATCRVSERRACRGCSRHSAAPGRCSRLFLAPATAFAFDPTAPESDTRSERTSRNSGGYGGDPFDNGLLAIGVGGGELQTFLTDPPVR
jgi:hypothetical protein